LSKLDKLHERLPNLHLRYFWVYIKYTAVKLHTCTKHKVTLLQTYTGVRFAKKQPYTCL